MHRLIFYQYIKTSHACSLAMHASIHQMKNFQKSQKSSKSVSLTKLFDGLKRIIDMPDRIIATYRQLVAAGISMDNDSGQFR